jgi:hypothetical protein
MRVLDLDGREVHSAVIARRALPRSHADSRGFKPKIFVMAPMSCYYLDTRRGNNINALATSLSL